MAGDQHPSKRRRVDAAAALSKPFKSPLRRPISAENSSQLPLSTPDLALVPQDGGHPVSLLTSSNASPAVTSPSPETSPTVHRHKPVARSSLSIPSRSPLSDPELLDLQKQERSLQLRMCKLRAEVDTARQALQIESSARDGELEGLIMKWRLVSQEAADEVFAGAQERVARMGGMSAWRERSKRDAMRWDFQEEGQEHPDGEASGHGSVEYDHDRLNPKNDPSQQADDKQEEASSTGGPCLGFHPKPSYQYQPPSRSPLAPALSSFNSRMSRPFKQREIACSRCFRLKRKCDHLKPTCGECRRKGAECLPARSRKSGDSITVPLAYLKELERRVAELEGLPGAVGSNVALHDVGVQTDSIPEPEISRRTPSCASWMAWETSQNSSANSKVDTTQDGNALATTSQSQPSILSPGQLSILSPSFSDVFSQLHNESLDFLRLGQDPTPPIISNENPWLAELYINIYFSISHREWPFLNETLWRSWHNEQDMGEQEEWQMFFLQMIYAIGASLCSTMHRDPLHSVRSKELYSSAMSYYPLVVGHPSMVLQVQASLLLIVYSLHSPSSEEIDTSVSSIVPFCTAAMSEIRKHARANRDGEVTAASGEVLTEDMFIACYMLNVIIASGWDRPVSAAYRVVDDDMCILGDIIQPPVTTNPALGHLFRLRKIQANIRRSLEASCWQFSEEKHAQNSSLKSALDIWRQDIPRYGISNVSCGYYHPNWMAKLYDYSILILLEEKRNFLDHEGTEDIFSAVVDVCLTFRRLQEEGHVMCFTWSALVYQFRAGIMLLYLIWATRPIPDNLDLQQTRRTYHSPEAIGACHKNIACFADRWDDALPYLKVFEFLEQKIIMNSDLFAPEITIVSLEEAESHLEHLKKKYLHRAILGMIEDMMEGRSVQYEPIPDDFVTGTI
ncbi:uncharacterized protein N7459_007453 [Penicillium hispanicum]|uniref:uncharacterized protein n=1 Tax=Penicillium hispanicum TaxID=1080232 RepID=UPI00253FC213|nr:uncharacterized protein N7459_007453 [Penicillium hispanicum]KAJ5578489.1 hypothetical protein N7459_007453 [Penicillium hispanicum]